MNTTPATEDILTPEQAQFIASFLHVVPKKAKKKAEEEAYNLVLTKEYKAYLADKAICLDQIRKAELAYKATKIRSEMSLISDAAFDKEMADYRNMLKTYTSGVETQIRRAEAAGADAPVFGDASAQLRIFARRIPLLVATLPNPPAAASGLGKERLIGCAAEAQGLLNFEDVREFDRKAAETKLKSAKSEKRRVERLTEHDTLVQDAIDKIDAFLTKPAMTATEIAAAGDTAEALLAAVVKKRGAIVRSLAFHLNGPAVDQLKTLRDAGDPIAMREMQRIEQIKESRKTLKAASGALRKQIKAKEKELKGDGRDLEKNPMGFDERRTLLAELDDFKQRRAEVVARSDQLRSYERTAAARVERIEANARDIDEAMRFLTSTDEKIAEILAARKQTRLEPVPASHKQLLLGGKDPKGKQVNGRFQDLRAKFQRSRDRVSVDARLFPSEDSLTDINDEQLGILNNILDKAKGMAVGGKLAEADLLMNEAAKLHLKFVGSNKFEVPERSDEEVSTSARVAAAIKDLTVGIDRFWGRGGDADDALRKRLTAIVAGVNERDAKKKTPDGIAERMLAELKADLLNAEAAFTPSPVDTAARASAAAAQQKLSAALLKLYKTKKLKDTEIRKVDPKNLLAVQNPDGSVSYHEILTERGGTRQELASSDVPLEVVTQLQQQAMMLEVLAAGEAPDCATEIAAAVKRSEDLMKNATTGAADYKHVKSRIAECEKLLANSDFNTWTPATLDPVRTEFGHFKKTYLTGMTAEKAKSTIDALHTKIDALKGDDGKLKADYDTVEGMLDAIDRDLKGDKKADANCPGKKLQELLKGGEKAIMKGVNTGPLNARELMTLNSMISGMQEDITKLLATGKHGTGYESKLKADIATARQTLDARTGASIERARKEADRIKKALKAEMDALAAVKPADGLAYIKQISDFLKNARTGAEAVIQIEKDMETAKEAATTALKDAENKLKDAKDKLGSYKEYKAVYDSIKTQIENTGKTYKNSKDPDWAKSQYVMQRDNAKELANDLSKLTPVSSPGNPIDLSKWQSALDTNIGKVSDAAESAAAILERRAKEDENQAADSELQDRVKTAAAALRHAKTVAVANMVKLKDGLQDDVKSAFGTAEAGDRKDKLAIVREKAMAEVRRIRDSLEASPSLDVYRNNPFDKGLGWAQFLATLHSLEVKILTELKPR